MPVNDTKSSAFQIVTKEEARLRRIGIKWQHVHVVEGVGVIIVDESTMKEILSERKDGQIFRGRFVSVDSKGKWTASWIDDSDTHLYMTGLTERLAYRFVLGYKVGREKQTSRYVGYFPKYRVNKGRDTY